MQRISGRATAGATSSGSGWTRGGKGPRIGPVPKAAATGRRQAASAARRPQGTGSLLLRRDRLGRETWYGKWRAGGQQRMQRLGPRRQPGETVGLTRRQAEAELRRLIAAEQ